MLEEEKWNAYSIRTRTPEGTMFVQFMENEKTDKLEMILINIGKAGSGLAAWADAASRLINMLIAKGVDAYDAALELSDMRSDKYILDNMVSVRSGPDGLSRTIQKYVRIKNNIRRMKSIRPGLVFDEGGARN